MKAILSYIYVYIHKELIKPAGERRSLRRRVNYFSLCHAAIKGFFIPRASRHTDLYGNLQVGN